MAEMFTLEDMAIAMAALGATPEKVSGALAKIRETKVTASASSKVKEEIVADLAQDEKKVDAEVKYFFSVAAHAAKVLIQTKGTYTGSHANTRADKQGIELETPSGRLVVMLYVDHDKE